MSARVSLRSVRLGLAAVLSAASLLLASADPPLTAATTRLVSVSGTDTGDCTASPCHTVSYAIAQAASGDLVSVAGGTYGEHITIDRPLTIHGAGAAQTFLDGGAVGGRNSVVIVNVGVTVVLDGVTIQNGSVNPFGQSGGGIRNFGDLTLSNAVVTHNHADSDASTPSTVSASGGGGIANFGTLTMTNTTISNNDFASLLGGGGILNDGNLVATKTTISGNHSQYDGGGIVNVGTATLTNCVVSDNAASASGGGIYNDFENGGALSITNSTIRDNSAGGMVGGGIDSYGGSASTPNGLTVITGSTISGNASPQEGGGIENNASTLQMIDSTVSGNNGGTASYSAGGIANVSVGHVALLNVTVAYNAPVALSTTAAPTAFLLQGTLIAYSTSGNNCAGEVGYIFASHGFNLESGVNCHLAQATDLSNSDPLLLPLADNGGTASPHTLTHAVQPNSPTIDAGGTPASGCPATDQRGISRPIGKACDIGAFEAPPAAAPIPRQVAPQPVAPSVMPSPRSGAVGSGSAPSIPAPVPPSRN